MSAADNEALATLGAVPRATPILIAGPTGSGKSALALSVAQRFGGTIVNADALQVYGDWRILTARPSAADEARVRHALYGHIGRTVRYSVGHWLREVAGLLDGPLRPILVGGTGLYFAALTEGLAEIPEIPEAVRAEARMLSAEDLRAGLDRDTLSRIDAQNPARLRRAWEVARATGRSLGAWQDATPAPLLPAQNAACFVIDAPKDWLSPRLAHRFDAMVDAGAIDEVAANLVGFDPTRPGDRAIGAAELAAHLRGTLSLGEARAQAIVATRQYAKRQRTWFRARMSGWAQISML